MAANEGPLGCKLGSMHYYDNSLYILWGFNRKATQTMDSSVWKFSLKSFIWEKIETNDIFPKCCAFKSVLYSSYIIVYGGRNNMNMINDLYTLNLIPMKNGKHTWKSIDGVNKPKGRRRHGMCVYHDLLVLYGGSQFRKIIFNDIYVAKIKDILKTNQVIWHKIDLDLPILASCSHTMSSNNNSIVCFGGITEWKSGTRNNQLIQFYNIHGEISSNQIISSNKIIPLISGYLKYTTQTYSFQIPKCLWIDIQRFVGLIYFINTIDTIKPRDGHNASLIDNKKLFIFGGYFGQNFLNDSHLIYLP